jgi:hypothetical protein
MSAERTYEAESKDGNLQEAIEAARQQLNMDLSENGVRDASASWTVTEISGKSGGFAGFCSIKVKITAKRSPEWAD